MLISDPSSEMYISAKKRYLKLLYNRQEYQNCIKNAMELIETIPNDSYAYEWILKIHCENFQYPELYYPKKEVNKGEGKGGEEVEEEFSMDNYVMKFTELCPNSILLPFVKAIDCYKQQQYAQTRTYLYKTLTTIPDYRAAIELLAKSETQMEAYLLAKGLWQQLGDKYLKDYAICLSYSKDEDDVKKALKIFHQKLKININNIDSSINSLPEEIVNALARYEIK